MRLLPVIAAVVVVTLIGLLSSIFIVDERKQALVLQFGQVKQIKTEPGLGFKVPFIQDVAYYEGRILPLETSALEVTPADERPCTTRPTSSWPRSIAAWAGNSSTRPWRMRTTRCRFDPTERWVTTPSTRSTWCY
jgi:hypothetical protein